MFTGQNPSSVSRDVPAKIITLLAAMRTERISAYKAYACYGIRREMATRILALAEEAGLVRVVSKTRKGHPVYALAALQPDLLWIADAESRRRR